MPVVFTGEYHHLLENTGKYCYTGHTGKYWSYWSIELTNLEDNKNQTVNIHTLFLYPPQTLFVGGILFSRCPSVRLSVRNALFP